MMDTTAGGGASAAGVDSLVRAPQVLFGLTVVLITHNLDLLWQVADRVAVLADGRVQAIVPMAEMTHMEHPAVRQFFDGPRGHAAQAAQEVAWKPA